MLKICVNLVYFRRLLITHWLLGEKNADANIWTMMMMFYLKSSSIGWYSFVDMVNWKITSLDFMARMKNEWYVMRVGMWPLCTYTTQSLYFLSLCWLLPSDLIFLWFYDIKITWIFGKIVRIVGHLSSGKAFSVISF